MTSPIFGNKIGKNSFLFHGEVGKKENSYITLYDSLQEDFELVKATEFTDDGDTLFVEIKDKKNRCFSFGAAFLDNKATMQFDSLGIGKAYISNFDSIELYYPLKFYTYHFTDTRVSKLQLLFSDFEIIDRPFKTKRLLVIGTDSLKSDEMNLYKVN